MPTSSRRAQAVGFGLQVGDVDVRDGAVVARLALGEPDLHLAVPEVRPALAEVDGGLLEAERLAVEAPRRRRGRGRGTRRSAHIPRARGRDPRGTP